MASLKYKAQLLRSLVNGDHAFTGPLYISIDPTRRCNIHCRGCFYHCLQTRLPSPGDHRIQDISLELVRKICEELPGLGTREAFIVGEGEPFMYPGLMEAVHLLKSAGLRVTVFTNGTLLDREKVQEMIELKLDELRITFWAVNEQEHEQWHPGVDLKMLPRRLEGMELLKAMKSNQNSPFPSVFLYYPLNRMNFRNIRQRVELAERFWPQSVAFGVFRDWGGDFEDLILSPGEVGQVQQELRSGGEKLRSSGIGHNIGEYLKLAPLGCEAWRAVPCYAGWLHVNLKVDGTVLPCGHCYIPMGNLMEQSLKEVWNGPKLRWFRRTGLSRKGLESLSKTCDCINCCQVRDNMRVHRVFRWFSPFIPRNKSSSLQEKPEA